MIDIFNRFGGMSDGRKDKENEDLAEAFLWIFEIIGKDGTD
jgi:hypothetical protein